MPTLTPLHHVVRGRPAAPVLFLVHPMGGSLEFWDDCAALWEDRFRIVACDLRGQGRSAIPDRPWSVDDHVADLMDLRRMLGLDDLIVVGCAMGSIIASAYAAADRENVRALVLSNTSPRLGEDSRQRTEARVALARREGIDALLPGVVDLAFNNLPKDARYDSYTELFRRNTPEGYATLALGMIGTDVAPAMESLDIPTLILAGEHDILLPPALSREAHALIPGSRFALVRDAAHFPPRQVPEVFAALVTEFVDGLGDGR